MAGVFPVGGGSDYRGTDWKGRRLGASGSWHVVPCRNGRAKSSGGNVSVWRSRVAVEGEGTSICPISDSSRSDGSMDGKMKRYKKKGRFVLEAAALIPGVCILLVYLVYFTLYAHDYAVCSHAALEAGTKGIYREGDSGGEMEEKICRDLQKKTESSSFVGERDGDPGEGESSTGGHPNHRTGRFPEGMFRDSGTKDKPDQAMHDD